MAMKVPTSDEVFSNREVWELADVIPSLGTNKKATSWAPACIDTITRTVLGTSASGIALVERVIIGDIVVELITVSYGFYRSESHT